MRLIRIKDIKHQGTRVNNDRRGHPVLENIYLLESKIECGNVLYRAGTIKDTYLFYEVLAATHQKTNNGWYSYVVRSKVIRRARIQELREMLDLLLASPPAT